MRRAIYQDSHNCEASTFWEGEAPAEPLHVGCIEARQTPRLPSASNSEGARLY